MATALGFPTPKMGETKALLNPYQVALEQLAPLEPLLAGFNRRNKSQHRRARWWASFNMLRRGLTKFLLELLAAAKSRAASSPGRTSAKSGKPKKYEDQHLADRADERARWMRDVLLHKCYLQFSQLTADNQFATLGVVLLGVLGQVRVGCCGIVGELDIEDNEEDRSVLTGKVVGGKISRETASSGGSMVDRDVLAIRQGGEGGGGVISREDAAARSAASSRREHPDGESAAGKTGQEQGKERLEQKTELAKPAVTKRKRDEVKTSTVHRESETMAVSAGNSDDNSGEKQLQASKKNNKEGEKNADDISAIFRATSPRPSKKIKRFTKEESGSIDDIFASTTTKTKTKSKDADKLKVKTTLSEGGGEKKKKKKKKAGKGSEFDDMFSSLL